MIITRRKLLLSSSLSLGAFAAPAIIGRAQPVSVFVQGSLGAAPIGTPTSFGAGQSGGIGNVSSYAISTSAAVKAGYLAIVAVTITTNNTQTVLSVSDGTNSYAKAETTGLYGTSTETSLWYKLNAAAVGSGATITVDFTGASGSGTNIAAILTAQVSGILTSGALDQVKAASTTAADTVTATTSTLGKANEIAFGYSAALNATVPTYSGAPNFTNLSQTTDGGLTRTALDYDTVAATTAVSFSPAYTAASFRMGGVVATFEGN